MSRERLYEILNAFLEGRLSTKRFCDEFTVTYDQHTDYGTLSPTEHAEFRELCRVASRFSPFPQDLVAYPKVYYDSEAVRRTAREVWAHLNSDAKDDH